MGDKVDQAETKSPRDLARDLIVNTLGTKRCAAWCEVERNTVNQWLARGTDDEPIPLKEAFLIARAAWAEGRSFDLKILAPLIPERPA